MKLTDLIGNDSPIIIKNINIINTDLGEKDDSEVVNPGIEYGDDDKAKWSPPLQQELSIMKSAVGVTPDNDTTELTPQDKQIEQTDSKDRNMELLKKLIMLFK